MGITVPPRPRLERWRNLYSAALLEKDRQKRLQIIAEAESAIVTRARELFAKPTPYRLEEEELDDALYALRALRTCTHLQTEAVA